VSRKTQKHASLKHRWTEASRGAATGCSSIAQ